SKVTRMEAMFSADYGSSSDNKVMKLKTLDLSSFDTSLVTNMIGMFNRCSNLTTIYVGANWNTSGVKDSAGMFAECTVLVGANGTSYANMLTNDADNANLVKYAVVDTESTPGYLTHI
ncbi:MAG: BspA family leucine-rich repeat surface protein, partial [Eubacteriales bacterium]|nr:BspA family leucine-rich repeat surface protein [Eubacteriales bacterium]